MDPENPENPRVVPPPRTESPGAGGHAFQRIREARLDDSLTTEKSREAQPESESDAEVSNIKVTAFIGGARAENWLDAVLGKLSPSQEKAYELVKTGRVSPQTFEKKAKAKDRELHSAILDSLIHKNATPEREATSIFNRLRANKDAIGRSGLLALAYIHRIIHGIDDQAGAALVSELIQVRVIHNNAEGVLAFITKFREIRSKLGDGFQEQYSIEILRARMMGDVGDTATSYMIAAAPFAQYDTRTKEEKLSIEVIDMLINQIENAAEQLMRHRPARKGGGRGREYVHATRESNPGERVPCEGCGKTHAGGIANCYTNAERILRERDEHRNAKGDTKGRGRGDDRRRGGRGRGKGEQQHLTDAPGGAPAIKPPHGTQPPSNSAPNGGNPAANNNNEPSGRDRLAEAVTILLAGRHEQQSTTVEGGFQLVGSAGAGGTGDEDGDDDQPPERRFLFHPVEKRRKPQDQ